MDGNISYASEALLGVKSSRKMGGKRNTVRKEEICRFKEWERV
jgi:hypothetical protein